MIPELRPTYRSESGDVGPYIGVRGVLPNVELTIEEEGKVMDIDK